ncbi:unannotated protein [freshwater metagenome]|uniref:Unannotated protein n=1 Tax=freshwater metagenome TaxID=449393 RepID=A0A6J7FZE2_9ZZZZ
MRTIRNGTPRVNESLMRSVVVVTSVRERSATRVTVPEARVNRRWARTLGSLAGRVTKGELGPRFRSSLLLSPRSLLSIRIDGIPPGRLGTSTELGSTPRWSCWATAFNCSLLVFLISSSKLLRTRSTRPKEASMRATAKSPVATRVTRKRTELNLFMGRQVGNPCRVQFELCGLKKADRFFYADNRCRPQ